MALPQRCATRSVDLAEMDVGVAVRYVAGRADSEGSERAGDRSCERLSRDDCRGMDVGRGPRTGFYGSRNVIRRFAQVFQKAPVQKKNRPGMACRSRDL